MNRLAGGLEQVLRGRQRRLAQITSARHRRAGFERLRAEPLVAARRLCSVSRNKDSSIDRAVSICEDVTRGAENPRPHHSLPEVPPCRPSLTASRRTPSHRPWSRRPTRLVEAARHRGRLSAGAHALRRGRHRGRLRRAAAEHRARPGRRAGGSSAARSASPRPPCSPARRGPARLRRAVRGHGRAGGRYRSPAGRLLQPKVEAEVALVLGRDLPHRRLHGRRRAAGHRLRAARPGDRRQPYRRTGTSAIVDTVADNASSGLFVLGGAPVPLHRARPARRTDDPDPRRRDGLRGHRRRLPRRPAQRGRLAGRRPWPAMGDPLRAGDIVLTGALGPMAAPPPGRSVRGPDRIGRTCGTDRRVELRGAQEGENMSSTPGHPDQGRGHRLRQHRHRPDDQGAAAVRAPWRWPRWPASTRTPTAWPAPAA